MSTPDVELAAIAVFFALAVLGLFTVGVARQWWGFTATVSMRFIPAAKRQPPNPVQVLNVMPGAVDQTGPIPVITTAKKTA